MSAAPGQGFSSKTVFIVPGGGVRPNGDVPPHSVARLRKAVDLFNTHGGAGSAVILVLSAGTTHKPNPTDARGFPIYEAAAAAKLLTRNFSVPASAILEENFSLDTIGNAFFARVMHMDAGGYRKAVVVTNNWHLDRVKAIFSAVFSLPMRTGIAHDTACNRYQLSYVGADDVLAPKALEARRKREAASLVSLRRVSNAHWFRERRPALGVRVVVYKHSALHRHQDRSCQGNRQQIHA